jgi:hypothetical protein
MNILMIVTSLFLSTFLVQFLPIFSQEIKRTSEQDHLVANRSMQIAHQYQVLMDINGKLEKLRFACAAAQARPELIPVISTTAQSLGRTQDLLLQKIKWEGKLQMNFTFQMTSVTRKPGGPCSIPGNLTWTSLSLASVSNQTSGSEIFINTNRVRWKYRHPGVRVL